MRQASRQLAHSQFHTLTKPQVGLSLGVVGVSNLICFQRNALYPPFPVQVGLSLGVVGVSVDGSGQYGAAASLDSYVTVWNMGDYSTGGCCCIW